MLLTLATRYSHEIQRLYDLLILINALLHVIFAGAIAKDAGQFYKMGRRPALVSGATWAFATLLGGVVTAAIYWFIHHSNLTRPGVQDRIYDKV